MVDMMFGAERSDEQFDRMDLINIVGCNVMRLFVGGDDYSLLGR